ncbi:TonB-dependent receptor plug domain-containing protein [Sulfurimonas sp.]|uniref:TonB-dependent receptor plug domain-containing protein n=1 Tax=Sulfurimonas sp. TaxID=2022749 RepID=UPI003D1052C8
MKIKSKVVMSLIVTSFLSTLLQAQTVLEQVDVNATPSSREDLDPSSVTNLYQIEKSAQFGVEVLDEEAIEAYKPKDFFDLINKATGMDVTYQGRKHPYFIRMRGGGDITYILDGAILPGTSDRILTKLPMSAIEEIQIVRTATAITLAPSIDIGASNSGSGTSVGYIIIRTKHPKKTQGLISGFTEKALTQPRANGQNIYLGTTFGDASSLNGYIGGMLSRTDRPSKEDWFDGSSANAGMINGGLNYGMLTLNLMGYKDSGRFEMQKGVATDGTISDVEWYYDPIKTNVVSLDGNLLWSENQITLFSASKINYSQDEYSSSTAVKNYTETTQTFSLRHKARFFEDTLINLGAQRTRSKGYGPNLSKSYNNYDTAVTGYAISLEQSLFNDALVLDAGYRYDQKHINHSTTAGGKGSNKTVAHDEANNDVDLAPAKVIALGMLYNLNDTIKMNARYYRGDEGSGDFDLVTEDNSTLHPEKQNRWEVGVQAEFTKAFKPSITYFDVKIKNEKTSTDTTYTDADGNEYYYYTEQDSHRKGVEVTINGVIQKNTNYKFSWTHMLSDETTQSSSTSDSVGVSTPKDIYSALLSHRYNDYHFNVSAKHVSEYSSSTSAMGVSSQVHLGDYIRIDANIMKDFVYDTYTFTAKLYGRNLTNDQYATRYTTGYYYDRGRTIGAELSFAF